MDMENATKRSRQDYIWNTTAGLINAAEAVIMSMIVTRITNLSDAGMLTIAFAIGNLMMTIGKFGVRNYQVTDVEQRYSFAVYVKSRLITLLLMIIASMSYLGYAYVILGYNFYKIGIIFAICMIYAVEAAEDVVWGYYQRLGYLAVGAKMFCSRWTGILVSFVIILCISRNLMITLLICLGVSILVLCFTIGRTYNIYCMVQDRKVLHSVGTVPFSQMRDLLWNVFPLFCSTFFAFYVNNAPKYAIDAVMTDEVQACYGFVAMPVFVIGLLNGFIYQPTLVYMSIEWNEGNFDQLLHRIKRQILIIAGLTGVCLIGAYILGIPVLSLLYKTDLRQYKAELMLLLVASGLLAASGYLGVVLTIMRNQKKMMVAYGVISIIAFVTVKHIVSLYGTLGAVLSYMMLMLLLCIVYSVILNRCLKGIKS